jgi:hypothetical protein
MVRYGLDSSGGSGEDYSRLILNTICRRGRGLGQNGYRCRNWTGLDRMVTEA